MLQGLPLQCTRMGCLSLKLLTRLGLHILTSVLLKGRSMKDDRRNHESAKRFQLSRNTLRQQPKTWKKVVWSGIALSQLLHLSLMITFTTLRLTIRTTIS